MKELIFAAFLWIACSVKAQQGFVVAGETQTESGGSVSFSVGQIDFSVLNNNNNAGIQQAYIYGPFPLSWLSFTGQKVDASALLKWETSSELNTSYFIVERSVDGVAFKEEIGKVSAKGTTYQISSYTFTDAKPYIGINYYRLRQIDKDGKYSYSSVVAIDFATAVEINFYPNPVSSELRLNISSGSFFGWSYRLYEASGKLIMASGISSQFTSIGMNNLQPGLYYLAINSLKGTSAFKIIKQ
jgi:hypothetical protein